MDFSFLTQLVHVEPASLDMVIQVLLLAYLCHRAITLAVYSTYTAQTEQAEKAVANKMVNGIWLLVMGLSVPFDGINFVLPFTTFAAAIIGLLHLPTSKPINAAEEQVKPTK
ncbi:hypothetical protein [Enterovibrio calviensis]|uniref:hypothetical protein n=1 Tax=Enterovibrio calviensis TaxID=91359 RepID=UPI0037358965